MPRGQAVFRPPQSPCGDTGQISRGKLNRLRCTTAGSTLCTLDGYRLRDTLPARPALAPGIRFLFIGSPLCSTLPSDPASRRQPLRFANPSPPSGWVEDFHLRAIEHARHTTKRLRRIRAGGDRDLPLWQQNAAEKDGPAPPSPMASSMRDYGPSPTARPDVR